MISVIMPCYLGEYPGAAKNRHEKLHRAINSFLDQGIGELVIVPDGCQETQEIASKYPVRCLEVTEKSKQFSGYPRNRGIFSAKYDYIAYLDSDDMFGEGHLKAISENIDSPWLYWDDYARKRRITELKAGSIGTSCIAHRKDLGIVWPDGYGHDWEVVQQLMKYEGKKIEANYRVMHIPGYLDE